MALTKVTYSMIENPLTATAAQLNAIADPINTTDKAIGKSVFNSTALIPVWAVGGLAADVWVDATGVTVNTPV